MDNLIIQDSLIFMGTAIVVLLAMALAVKKVTGDSLVFKLNKTISAAAFVFIMIAFLLGRIVRQFQFLNCPKNRRLSLSKPIPFDTFGRVRWDIYFSGTALSTVSLLVVATGAGTIAYSGLPVVLYRQLARQMHKLSTQFRLKKNGLGASA